jgi:hypothetical protein
VKVGIGRRDKRGGRRGQEEEELEEEVVGAERREVE